MKYTIGIPTMLKAQDQLRSMLCKYNESVFVGEILLVDNAGLDREWVSKLDKVKILNDGKNLYVNPSWNLIVQKASYDKVILANDDIYIEDLKYALCLIDIYLEKGMLIGMDVNNFSQRRKGELGMMEITPVKGARGYGFGVFMAFCKQSYIPIPKQLKVFWGDTYLYNKLDPWVIKGINVLTEMRTTSRTLDKAWIREQKVIEKKYFETLKL